jgi:hypothetical protein
MIEELAKEYPVLFLNPDVDTQEEYKRIVLKGEQPRVKSLAHYKGDDHDDLRITDTPAGNVRVATFGNRHDFELIMRGLMAAKDGPEKKIPATQGAAMLTVINWNRIHDHLAGFPDKQQSDEFKRFISVKENYIDMLVVLSRGPYSNLSAGEAGISDAEWLELSDTIRRYHELTHVICRRLYPDNIDAVRDELIADAVGLYAAFGYFDVELEKKFLGIYGNTYTGGRLENYTDETDQCIEQVCRKLSDIKAITDEAGSMDPFDVIPLLICL